MDFSQKAIDQPKIRVVIRKRPLNKKELARNQQDVVEVMNYNEVVVRQQKVKVDLTKYLEQHQFKFDYALGQQISNSDMYRQCVKPIVQCAFMGAKVTCFAYGQTGSGKTYTMNGDIENNTLGMYYLGAQDIFSLRDMNYPQLDIHVSFYEIYCGKLFDLLNSRQQLQARQDAKQNVNIVGLTVKKVNSIQDFMSTIAYGSSVRITSQNSTNSDSSRSHAILQIDLKYGKKNHGKISFIDLAGCERGADTLDQNKQTKIDGAEINKSLLALKQCIRALDQGKNHTPFRGSKLTMVLKDSFTGFCKTLMIGNISPGSGSCQNTLNTLRYADRVKQLKKGGGNNEPISKEQRIAKQLMLPRNGKAKQIIANDSDSDDEKGINLKQKNQNNANMFQLKPNQQPTPIVKKPKYILKDENQRVKNSNTPIQTRKNMINSQANPHQQPLKSVNHFGKAVSKPQLVRNKSVLGKQKIVGCYSRAVEIPLISERNNFQQNNSMMVNKKQLKDINIQLQNQLNCMSSKHLTLNRDETVDRLLGNADNREWERIVDKFRRWMPSQNNFAQMSQLFEELVKFIMKQQVQIGDLHKNILLKEQKNSRQLSNMYHQTQSDNKNNEEMHQYAARLSKFLQGRMKNYNQLKIKADIYQLHLRQHQFCESKLIQAGELLGNQLGGLWQNNPTQQYASLGLN